MSSLFPQIDKPVRLEVLDLTLSRGDKPLIEGLSFELETGDVLWAQGDNGIGKTTLLEALAGLRRPDDGAITWREQTQSVQPNKLMAYQPHRSFAKPTLSVKEDLTFWARLHKTQALRMPALDYVGLIDRADIAVQGLSAGQRRRLALAKLIISQKTIWIMDEPAAAMDGKGVELIDKLISQHVKRGGIAIIASHDVTRKLSANTRKLVLRAAA